MLAGYLLKDSSPAELIQAIGAVCRGEPSLSPSIALKLVAQGLSNQGIAERLLISERTVSVHISTILAKLHLANRTQAALYALREGLASLNEGQEKIK